jgi:hypothetical protein
VEEGGDEGAEEGGDGREEARVGDEHAEVEVDRGGDPRLEHEGAQLDGLHGVELQDQGLLGAGVHGGGGAALLLLCLQRASLCSRVTDC